MNALLLVQHCSLLALLVVAAYTDLSRGKVYNWCTYPAIGLGLALGHILDAYGPGHLVNSIAGLAIAVAIFALPYFLGWVSAGDIKLVAAIGAVAGAKVSGQFFVLYATVYSAVVGAVLAVAVLIWRGQLWTGLKGSLRLLVTFRRVPRSASSPDTAAGAAKELTIPYGFAIASGTMLAWFIFLARGLLAGPKV